MEISVTFKNISGDAIAAQKIAHHVIAFDPPRSSCLFLFPFLYKNRFDYAPPLHGLALRQFRDISVIINNQEAIRRMLSLGPLPWRVGRQFAPFRKALVPIPAVNLCFAQQEQSIPHAYIVRGYPAPQFIGLLWSRPLRATHGFKPCLSSVWKAADRCHGFTLLRNVKIESALFYQIPSVFDIFENFAGEGCVKQYRGQGGGESIRFLDSR